MDQLLQEKKESLHEQMSLHKLIRDYEQQLGEMRGILKDKDSCIEQLEVVTPVLAKRASTMLEVMTDSEEDSPSRKLTQLEAAAQAYADFNKDSTTSAIKNEM